jgi:hypothetical protein
VLMDILHTMRELGGENVLTPIQAMDLWADTGSHRCFQQMCSDGAALPAPYPAEKH